VSVPELPGSYECFKFPCEAVDGEAVRYFFNGLPRERSGAVRTHLTECPRCQRKLEVFEGVWVREGRRRAGRA
jgi:hypothetical protein